MEQSTDPIDDVILTPIATPPPPRLTLKVMMLVIAGFAIVFWGIYLFQFFGVFVGALFLVGSFITLASLLQRIKMSRQETLLLSLAVAYERAMPLAPAALAFAEQYSAGFRYRVQRLAAMLDEGVPLPTALRQIRGIMSGESRVLARAGWDAGCLGPALRQAAALKQFKQDTLTPAIYKIAYLCVLVLFMETMLSFVMYFIMPKFEAIFSDFGVNLPAPTIFTIEVAHFLTGHPLGLLLFALLQLCILLTVPVAMLNMFELDLSFLDILLRRRHIALILRSLALTVDGHKPMESGLAVLTSEFPSTWISSRLAYALHDVKKGEQWAAALYKRGLLRAADLPSIEAGSRLGNLGWVLRQLADSSDRRAGFRIQFWTQMLFPCVLLLLGLVVLVVAVAYFAPLVTLIERLA